jgi:alkyl hydroperoxide reductase subunit F
MYDVTIVGGGPAGLAAAVYAARKRLSTALISVDIGGQVNRTLGVENYLGYQFIEGADLIGRFQSQVAKYPIDQQIGARVSSVRRIDGGFEMTLDSGVAHRSRVVVFAAGKRPRQLDVPGESRLAGRGVSYCAICDGPVFADRRVAVVGGGNSALEAALDLVKIAEHVDLVSLTGITGDQILLDKLKAANNLDTHLEYSVDSIQGTDFVEGMVIRNLKNGEALSLDVSGVFVEIGLIPNSEALQGLLDLNGQGEVPVNCSGETSVPGLFAAGDVSDVPEKQIIVAAGEGAKAMLRAHRYLQRLAV